MHRLPCEAEFIDPAPESIAREQNLIIWSSSAAAAALRHHQADGSRARLFGAARRDKLQQGAKVEGTRYVPQSELLDAIFRIKVRLGERHLNPERHGQRQRSH